MSDRDRLERLIGIAGMLSDHVDCFAALGSSRRFGLEESGSTRCGPTIASWIKIANSLAIHAIFE
jgi:hypothetical protein